MPEGEPTDAELVAAINAGDVRAFEALYFRHRDWVLRLARRFTVDESDALDVLQETFVEVICNIDRFRGDADVGTWIKRIAINKCLMHVRSSWVSRRSPEVEEPAGEHRSAAVDDQMALERALDRVPDVARAVVWLHDVEGYTHAEIGRLMGRTTSFSKSQLARGHARLREDLQPPEQSGIGMPLRSEFDGH